MTLQDILKKLRQEEATYASARNTVYALGFAKSLKDAEKLLDQNGFEKIRKAAKNFDDEVISWFGEEPRTGKEMYEYFLENATPNKIRWIGLFDKVRIGMNRVHDVEGFQDVRPTKEILDAAKKAGANTPTKK